MDQKQRCAVLEMPQFHPSLLAEPEMGTVCQTKDLDNELEHKNGNLFFSCLFMSVGCDCANHVGN